MFAQDQVDYAASSKFRGKWMLRIAAFSVLIAAQSAHGQSGPGVAAPATATPNPVTGTTTTLNVLGTDGAGEASLVYTWSAVGPAPVTFSGNGTNASKNAT